MDQEKIAFVKSEFVSLTKKLESTQMGHWGKMNAQQMVEHITDIFDVAAGKTHFPLVSPVEHLPKLTAFLWSDKQFRENTKAPVEIIAEEPLAARNKTMELAIEELQKSTDDFFNYFNDDGLKTTVHPVFGALNFEEWVQLQHKHLMHHGRQFGLV
jgi:DinB superfamily